MTRNESKSNKATAAADKPATIWIGTIPDIFGYGFAVTGHTKAECDQAMRAAYRKWKRETAKFFKSNRQDYNPADTNYDDSFRDKGGSITEIKIGQVYYDNFAS